MTKQELNRFRMILTARMRELERLIAYRDGIAIERSPDELDQMQRASELALAVSNLDREFKQLRNVRAALRRIQEGSFGTCQECDQDIHAKRLTAVPWAAYCIRCQEILDRNPEEMQTLTRDILADAA